MNYQIYLEDEIDVFPLAEDRKNIMILPSCPVDIFYPFNMETYQAAEVFKLIGTQTSLAGWQTP